METAQMHLRMSRLRATQTSIEILQFFEDARRPIDALTVQKALPHINRVSVFRIIKRLVEHELINEVSITAGTTYYERAGNKHHHHITCIRCHKIEELFLCDQTTLVEEAREQSSLFGTILAHQLEFRGVCKSCERKTTKPTC